MRLYSLGQIVLACFLGGPFAGAWLLGLDQRALGRKSRWTFIVGALVQIALVVLMFFLPSSTPAYAVPFVYVTIMRLIADAVVGSEIKQHLAAGGARASWGKTVGMGFAALASVLLLGIGLVMGGPEQLVHQVRYGTGNDISYEDGATRDEAKAAAAFMQREHILGDANISITLSHHDDKLVMRTSLLDEDRANPVLIGAWRRVFALLAAGTFPGRAVEIGSTDVFGKRIYPLTPLGVVRDKNAAVFYEPHGDEALARRVAQTVSTPNAFVKAIVDKEGDRCIIVVITDAIPEGKFDAVARELSEKACGGNPVTLRLTTDGVNIGGQAKSDQ